MHVCVDARMYRSSGIGTYLQNLLPALARSFELTLIGDPKEIDDTNSLVIPTDLPIYSIAELRRLPSLIPPCDWFWSPHYNVPLLPIRARHRLVTIHDVFHLAFSRTLSLKQRVYAQLMFRAAVRRSNQIVTVSEFSRDEIVKYLGVSPQRITVIPNGVDHQRFKIIDDNSLYQRVRAKYQLPERFVLFVGNVKPHKNLITLVKAWHSLAAAFQDHQLVIVGKKEGFITGDNLLQTLIQRDKTLRTRIRFTGFVADDDLPVIYNLADLFVFPSYYEGFGLPPLEAMACGCPVLMSDQASLPEVGGTAAAYTAPDQSEAMAKQIADILQQNEEQRLATVRRGLAQAQRYTWSKSIDAHQALIENLLSERSR